MAYLLLELFECGRICGAAAVCGIHPSCACGICWIDVQLFRRTRVLDASPTLSQAIVGHSSMRLYWVLQLLGT